MQEKLALCNYDCTYFCKEKTPKPSLYIIEIAQKNQAPQGGILDERVVDHDNKKFGVLVMKGNKFYEQVVVMENNRRIFPDPGNGIILPSEDSLDELVVGRIENFREV
jgi:hypothetical protein